MRRRCTLVLEQIGDQDGTVMYPFVGLIRVVGTTPTQIELVIVARL